jgi:hypothetical protein
VLHADYIPVAGGLKKAEKLVVVRFPIHHMDDLIAPQRQGVKSRYLFSPSFMLGGRCSPNVRAKAKYAQGRAVAAHRESHVRVERLVPHGIPPKAFSLAVRSERESGRVVHGQADGIPNSIDRRSDMRL